MYNNYITLCNTPNPYSIRIENRITGKSFGIDDLEDKGFQIKPNHHYSVICNSDKISYLGQDLKNIIGKMPQPKILPKEIYVPIGKCYHSTDIEEILKVAGIEHPEDSNMKVFRERYINNDSIAPQKAIPYISHHIWTSDPKNPKQISEENISILLQSIAKLDSTYPWQHLFWTNIPDYFPKKLAEAGLQFKLIQEEFSDPQYKKHLFLFNTLLNTKYFKVSANDFIRAFIVYEKGGLYFDLDYKICKPIDELMIKYDSVFCRDSIAWPHICNGFFAAHTNHPIVKKITENIIENYDCAHQPIYIKHTCSIFSNIVAGSGPLVYSLSYYQYALTNKITKDVAFPSPHIVSIEIAEKAKVGLIPKIYEKNYCQYLPEISYGNDKFSASWLTQTINDYGFYSKLKASGEIESCFSFPESI